MRAERGPRIALGARLGGLLALVLLAGAATGDETRSPREIVQTAFDRMFNYTSVRTAEFHVFRHGELVAKRNFDVVYRRIEGRGHTLLRFTAPEYLDGTALLMVERSDGGEDTWLYRESQRRVRRVSTSQKADSFYGTDFTFEDLEHHDWSQFDVERVGETTREGRAVHVLEARPRRASQYARLRVEIEKERLALLRMHLFKPGDAEPFKSLRVEPEAIEVRDGLLVPRRMAMVQHGREARTEVRFRRVETDAEISRTVFSSMRLERSGVALSDLVRRLELDEDDGEGADDEE